MSPFTLTMHTRDPLGSQELPARRGCLTVVILLDAVCDPGSSRLSLSVIRSAKAWPARIRRRSANSKLDEFLGAIGQIQGVHPSPRRIPSLPSHDGRSVPSGRICLTREGFFTYIPPSLLWDSARLPLIYSSSDERNTDLELRFTTRALARSSTAWPPKGYPACGSKAGCRRHIVGMLRRSNAEDEFTTRAFARSSTAWPPKGYPACGSKSGSLCPRGYAAEVHEPSAALQSTSELAPTAERAGE